MSFKKLDMVRRAYLHFVEKIHKKLFLVFNPLLERLCILGTVSLHCACQTHKMCLMFQV